MTPTANRRGGSLHGKARRQAGFLCCLAVTTQGMSLLFVNVERPVERRSQKDDRFTSAVARYCRDEFP
jgi:hypothetical protein